MTYHKPGIYFGMPDTEYHADPSLSASGIKKLITDPEEFYDTWAMNPNPAPRENKDCLSRGTLWHCRILEPELFDQKYILAPHLQPGFFSSDVQILRTIDDMKGWLDANLVPYKKSGWNKPDFERAILEAYKLGLGKPEPYLIDFESAAFVERHKDKTVIWSREILDAMLAAERAVMEHPYFSKVFQGGMSEVSIFWVDQDTGIPMKRRVDKLKPRVNLDYKTLYVARGKSTRKAALDAIKYERYDLDVAVTTIAVAQAVNMINAGTGVIEGDVPGAFIDEFRQTPEKPFGFVFQKEERPYTVRGLKIVRRGGELFNVFGNGLVAMQTGLQLYQKYWEEFGPNRRWVDQEGMTEVGDHEIYYA